MTSHLGDRCRDCLKICTYNNIPDMAEIPIYKNKNTKF